MYLATGQYAEAYKNWSFYFPNGKYIDIFPDRESKMGIPLISQTGKIPTGNAVDNAKKTDVLPTILSTELMGQ